MRDHHQSKIAEIQGDVVKKPTVIASLVLVPSLIVASTVAQLVLYRWRRWI